MDGNWGEKRGMGKNGKGEAKGNGKGNGKGEATGDLEYEATREESTTRMICWNWAEATVDTKVKEVSYSRPTNCLERVRRSE